MKHLRIVCWHAPCSTCSGRNVNPRGLIVNIGTRVAKQAAAVVVAAVGVAATAHAAVVPSWAWQNEAGFISFTSTVAGTVDATGSTPVFGWFTRLTWPKENPAFQSNLHVQGNGSLSNTSPGKAFAVTNGPATFGVNLTHDNFPLQPAPGGDLLTAFLRDKLWLSPAPGPAFPVNPGDPVIPPLQFDIHFAETPNDGNGGICADGSSRTLDPINAAGCSDLFGVQSASAFQQQFVFMGQTYQITIAATGLGPQNATFCAAINLAPGCVGFRTAENQSNDLNPFFTIITIDVPEPNVLALLGVGLALLGFCRRRQS